MKPPNYDPLKREVERVYGKKVVTYSDCLNLSKEITLRTGFRLNVNTLRRFFGLVQASYPPSVTTLDILSRFCGCKSYEDFTAFEPTQVQGDEVQSSSLLRYVDLLFRKAAITTYADPTWSGIVRETILYMEKYPHLIDAFQRNIVRTQVGQEIYFEQFVNLDQLNGYFGYGIRYYLAAKNTREGRLFAHALLAYRYYLTLEEEALERHYHELQQDSIDERVHPFLAARYFAAQVFYHYQHPEEIFKVLSSARECFKHLLPSKDMYQTFPCFELFMAEALILSRQPLEALFYIQEARKKRSDYYPPAVDKNLFSPFDLYEAAAYTMLGEEEKAKKAFRRVNPMEFYFLSRQFHNIIYLTVESHLFPAKERANSAQITDLIRQTGFLRMRGLLHDSAVVNKKEQDKSFLL
ncbi:MAG TPA: hypothetical protein VGN63_01720 [Flavisolibacter sp.]|jgi:hypothetical protein|nr:hypothetical protein [Flavisolibacter sp.]